MKLKTSDIVNLIYPEFNKLNEYRPLGNKYFKIGINSHCLRNQKDWNVFGTICGITLEEEYSPEGYERLKEKLNTLRQEIGIKLWFVEAEKIIKL